MTDETLAWRIERVCLKAWPALKEEKHGDWLLRFSNGHVRRAINSANPLRVDPPVPGIAACAARFRARGLPPIFRLPTMVDDRFDQRLEQMGYRIDGRSLVIFGAVAGATDADRDVVLSARPSEPWLSAAGRLRGLSAEAAAVFDQTMKLVTAPAAFAFLYHDGIIVSVAYAVVAEDLICFESVATDPAWRNRGMGRRLVATLLAWGRHQGATGACLQVETDNAPALALYRRSGLTQDIYRYHYRRAPD